MYHSLTGEESRRGAYEAAKPGREGRRARAGPGEDGEGRRDESRRDEGEGEGEGEGEARRGEEGQYRQTNTVMIITFSKVPGKMYRRRYLKYFESTKVPPKVTFKKGHAPLAGIGLYSKKISSGDRIASANRLEIRKPLLFPKP